VRGEESIAISLRDWKKESGLIWKGILSIPMTQELLEALSFAKELSLCP
jgi:hypothetical protein